MSASLLASLFTVIAASSAFAAPGTASVTSAGSVPRAGTSATAATFTFTEDLIADWGFTSGAPGTLTVTILDSGGFNTLSFTGTPTLVAPGSLNASVAVGSNTFTVTLKDNDPLNAEQFSVQGLKIEADGGAALGAIRTTYTAGGSFPAGYFDAATATATGTLGTQVNAAITAGVSINVTSACSFNDSGNSATFATSGPDARALSAVTAIAGGVQTATFGAGTTIHTVGQTVSQTVAGCTPGTLASAGTVVDSLDLTVEYGPYGVQPGLFNQEIGGFELAERSAPFITAGTVISATITTAGVVWSNSIEANTHDFAGTEFELVSNTSTLSADRKTVTWTVSTASTAGSYGYMHSNGTWNVDVAANAVLGTAIDVTVTAGSLLVVPTSVALGYINNVIAGSAAAPTVYIGENDQSTGMVTIKEAAVGSFTAGGSNNVFEVCLDSGYEFFTRAPFAVVTASNLKLRDPSTLLGTTSLKGVLSGGSTCATWTIYSASTDVPAVIDIRGSDATGAVLAAGSLNGVRINVNSGAPIGTVNLNISSGTATSQTDFAILPIAVRAFRSSVIVMAVSQPVIPAGSADSLGGDISITETLTGQFRNGQTICVAILPRSSNNAIQDTFLKTANTNDRPVITATPGSGLVVGPVSIGCTEDSSVATNATNSFQFDVLQQAFAPNLGKITVSNIHFITVADAPSGSVLVNVFGDTGGGGTNFQSVVSNARIGAQVAGTASTRLGVTQVGAFTTSTKVTTTGKYVTYRFDFGVGAAGQTFKIWGATKTGNDWSAFAVVTSRTANASGVVYYHIRQNSATWKSYRAQWANGGVYTPARQSRWVP